MSRVSWISPCSIRLFSHLLQGSGITADQDLFLCTKSHSLLLELSWKLHWVFLAKKKKNPSSLLKAFVLCEERGWGAVGWRLLFSICTRWCFGLEGKQGFQNNGDWLLLLVVFFFCCVQVISHKTVTAPPASINSTKAALRSPLDWLAVFQISTFQHNKHF